MFITFAVYGAYQYIPTTTSAATPVTTSVLTTPVTTALATVVKNSSGLTDGTYTGTEVSEQYGNVQVQVTVSGGVITNAKSLIAQTGPHETVQITGYALPILRSEVIAVQSSKVNIVSGATVISDAYIQSVASAIAKARA
jgi:uncharacterized protein with FMN-binding domain